MTTQRTDPLATAEGKSPLPAPRVATSEHTRAGPPLTVHTTRPQPSTAVLTVSGSLDEVSTPHLQELLEARLVGTLRTLVLDFTELDFFGVDALNLLVRATRRADIAGISLLLVDDPPPCVERALRAGHLTDHLDRVPLAPAPVPEAAPGIATA